VCFPIRGLGVKDLPWHRIDGHRSGFFAGPPLRRILDNIAHQPYERLGAGAAPRSAAVPGRGEGDPAAAHSAAAHVPRPSASLLFLYCVAQWLHPCRLLGEGIWSEERFGVSFMYANPNDGARPQHWNTTPRHASGPSSSPRRIVATRPV